MSSVERHEKICEGLNDLYRRKNADYGDSFSRQFAEYGITSSVIRIEDKFLRLKQLSKNEALVEDETIEDTLVDLANYAIMTVMELQKSKLTGGSIGHENQVEPFFEALEKSEQSEVERWQSGRQVPVRISRKLDELRKENKEHRKTIKYLEEKIEIYEKALPDNSDVAMGIVKENELYRELLEEVIEEGSCLMIDRISDVLYSDDHNDRMSK